MISILVFIYLVAVSIPYCYGVGNAPESMDWESYKSFHGKVFVNNAQESNNKKAFMKNVKEIEKHNQLYEEGKVDYTKELNAFADQDPKTFAKTHFGYQEINDTGSKAFEIKNVFANNDVPESFDWRDQDKVSPVKNQGGCGSCWAFASVSAIESLQLIAGKQFQSLSEQQLVDCDKNDKGCNGGHPTLAFRYVVSTGGVMSESSYGYKGRAGTCRFDKNKVVASIRGYQRVRGVDEMMSALVQAGPIVIGVNADDLGHYSGGIYSCRSNRKNHAVLLVGYGSENGKDFWIIKNSWGKRWGEQGFGRISRDESKDCGVKDDGTFPQ